MAATKETAKDLASKFVARCRELGWSFSFTGSVVRVEKNFTPGDNQAYTVCDSESYELLSLVPVVKADSSIWGTDGGSVGGYVGLKNGYYRLNKSAPKKTFINELSKIR